jgi:hypothetical protein
LVFLLVRLFTSHSPLVPLSAKHFHNCDKCPRETI